VSAKVDAKEFAAAVAHAQRALSPHPPMAEYAALPLTVEDGELSLSGYDGRTLATAI
jgi:DNA polymerase III sliding clamp (beta) subunit (PCNA family)